MESDIIRYYEQYDEEGRLTRRMRFRRCWSR